MKKSYQLKLTTLTGNIRYLNCVCKGRPIVVSDSDSALVFWKKADIKDALRMMTKEYRNQNWEIVER